MSVCNGIVVIISKWYSYLSNSVIWNTLSLRNEFHGGTVVRCTHKWAWSAFRLLSNFLTCPSTYKHDYTHYRLHTTQCSLRKPCIDGIFYVSPQSCAQCAWICSAIKAQFSSIKSKNYTSVPKVSGGNGPSLSNSDFESLALINESTLDCKSSGFIVVLNIITAILDAALMYESLMQNIHDRIIQFQFRI